MQKLSVKLRELSNDLTYVMTLNNSADPLMSASLKQSLSETLRVSERLCLIFEALSEGCFAYMSYL